MGAREREDGGGGGENSGEDERGVHCVLNAKGCADAIQEVDDVGVEVVVSVERSHRCMVLGRVRELYACEAIRVEKGKACLLAL